MSDDFFKEAGEQFKKGMNWLGDKTSDLLDAGGNKINLVQAKGHLNDEYQKLGRMFYDMSVEDKLEIEILRTQCDVISKLLSEINALQNASENKSNTDQSY